MQLPQKVQIAIQLLGQFDMPRSRVAPTFYRLYLRLRPDTPPPLWGASPAYWDFHAVLTALIFGAAANFLVSIAIWQNGAFTGPIDWSATSFFQGIIWAIAGTIGQVGTRETRRSAARRSAVLGLPAWEHFHAQWRPTLESLRHQTEPVHYWLRSLWNDSLVKRAGVVGILSFVAVAALIPATAGSYGNGMAMAYLGVAVIGFARTYKRTPLPQGTVGAERAVGWRCANGFWIGTVLAAVVWQTDAHLGTSASSNDSTFFFAVAALLLHLSEWFSFSQQKDLALRAERAEHSRQLAEARLQMLKNQIEPHFIFNTLAHLKALIPSEPQLAERMADELSDFLRASLKFLREDTVTVAQDFELIRAYLALASLRMGERLQVDLHCAPETASLPIPPLLLQTLVENAIQHGIEPKAGPGRITVSTSVDRSQATAHLVLSVADDGPGFGQARATGSGLGLVNIRERLVSSFGSAAKLTLTTNTPHGVIATLSLPLPPEP